MDNQLGIEISPPLNRYSVTVLQFDFLIPPNSKENFISIYLYVYIYRYKYIFNKSDSLILNCNTVTV